MSVGDTTERDGKGRVKRRFLRKPLLRTQSDARLVELFRAGCEPAFEVIVERYRGPLLRYCRQFVDPDRAEDAVQLAFEDALVRIRDESRRIAIRPWLYRVAHNRSIDALRRKHASWEQLEDESADVPEPPVIFEQGEHLRGLLKRVTRLPDRQRTALILRALEGRSYDEIAGELQVTGASARKLIQFARERLRDGVGALVPIAWLRSWAERADASAHASGAMAGAGVGGGLVKAGAALFAAGAIAVGVGVTVKRDGSDSDRSGSAAAGEPPAHATALAEPGPRLESRKGRGEKKGGRRTPGATSPDTATPPAKGTPGAGPPGNDRGGKPRPDRGGGEDGAPGGTGGGAGGGSGGGDTDRSLAWLASATLSDSGQSAKFSQVAIDSQGNAFAVWQRSDGANWRIQAAVRPAGGAFGAAQTISDSGQDATNAQVAADPEGNVVAVWQRSDGANSRIQVVSRPAGGAFGVAKTISDPGQSAWEPRIAADPEGNTVAVWRRSEGPNTRIRAAFRPAGGAFESAQTISEAGWNAAQPRVATGSGGNAVAVWESSDGANWRIQAAVRPAGGAFGAARTMSAAGINPNVATDPQGNAVAVWNHMDGNLVVQAALRPAGGSFGSAQTISDPSRPSLTPRVAVDQRGNAVAVWTRSGGIQAASRPAGGAFGVAQTISGPGGNAAQPRVAADPEGNAVAVWQRSDGANWRIQAAPYE